MGRTQLWWIGSEMMKSESADKSALITKPVALTLGARNCGDSSARPQLDVCAAKRHASVWCFVPKGLLQALNGKQGFGCADRAMRLGGNRIAGLLLRQLQLMHEHGQCPWQMPDAEDMPQKSQQTIPSVRVGRFMRLHDIKMLRA